MAETKEITIEKQFKVLGLIACPDDMVLLTLEPIEDTTPTVEAKPMFKSEDERVGYEIGMGIMKGLSQYGPVITMAPLGPGGRMMSSAEASSHIFSIRVPTRDYEVLGMPTVNDIIFLDVRASVKERENR